MDFRWIAGLTLWTILSGPVLVHWTGSAESWRRQRPLSAVQRPVPSHEPLAVLANASEEGVARDR